MPTKISPVKNQKTEELLWNAYDGNPFGDDGISAIRSDMENVEIPVTSIPSPFSQMHLFATAFSHLNTEYKKAKDGDIEQMAEGILNEKSTYNRAISDCLDIFELLYSYEILSLGDSISIRTWDKNELKTLKESGHNGQKTFAETLESYGNNYSGDPRFRDPKADKDAKKAFDQFILIYFNDRILAGGSPLTGFFFNREKDVPKIKKHDGKEFFSTIIPLYQRDLEFQIFLSIFFGGNARAVEAFSEFNQYRINNNEVSNNDKLQNIVVKLDNMGPDAIPDEYKDQFKLLNIGGNSPLYLLGETEEMQYKYKAVKSGEKKEKASKSDYAIKTSKTLSNPPLVLIEKSQKKHWKLLDGPLDEEIDLRKDLGVEVAKRILPGTMVSYPYLQQGDLFADNLIQLRYDVNEERFWAFGDQDNDTSSLKNVLLPIKPAYFRYFTIDDLRKQLFIERQNSGSVVVKLNIPVLGDGGTGVITFRKTFTKTINLGNDNKSQEKGAIVSSSFGFGIYPFFKVDSSLYNDQYKILQYCDENENVQCDFIRENLTSDRYDSVTNKNEVERTRKEEGQLYKSKYTELSVFEYGDSAGTTIKDEDITFDMIVVKISNAESTIASQGVVFPIFSNEKSIQANSLSKIAFDIGTSNSYVALSSGDDDHAVHLDTYNSHSKSVGLHLALLHKPEYDDFSGSSMFDFNSKNNDILRFPQLAEFLPSIIGPSGEFSLPIPTVINQDNDADSTDRKNLSSLINVNIPFGYGQQALRTHGALGMVLDQLFSNLKWAISKKYDTSAKNRLYLFVDQLVWMARNKILSMGLDPSATEVIWFKPLSMDFNQGGVFTEIWNEVYDKYFGKKKGSKRHITSVTESWAPFFSQKQAFGAGNVYMNIDIGGGTSDILVFDDGQPALTTSFRFAGNALFEGGLKKDGGKENGFYVKYEALMLSEFDNNPTVKRIIKGITSSKGLQSSDLISYFFQLKEFRDSLKLDGDFQLLFLLHNAAIFYHAAQILKIGGFSKPFKIGLSGNGAKLIFLTNRDEDLNRYRGVGELVTRTFAHIYESDGDDDHTIELEVLENPKNATAIGGIKGLEKIKRQKDKDIKNFNISLGDNATLLKGKRDLEEYSYRQIRNQDAPTIGKVVDNVCGFFEFFFEELWFDVDFTDSFGLSKTFDRKKLKAFFCDKQKIKSSIRTAINNKIDDDGIDELSETLFFYAITEYIFQFSKILVNKTDINKFQY